MYGTVEWFSPGKGYGFIRVDGEIGNCEQVFVHHAELKMDGFRALRAGDRVEFEYGHGEKGSYAKNVSCLQDE